MEQLGDDMIVDWFSPRSVLLAAKLNEVLDEEQVTEVDAMAALVCLMGFACVPSACQEPMRPMNNSEEQEAHLWTARMHAGMDRWIKAHQEAAALAEP